MTCRPADPSCRAGHAVIGYTSKPVTTARSSRAVPGQRLGVETTHCRCSAPPLEPPLSLLIARLLRDKGICEYDRGRGRPRSRVRVERLGSLAATRALT
ncbi:MAG TPA: hypothetical protein VFZ10_16465, partial [Geminicoccaceae bacterium]